MTKPTYRPGDRIDTDTSALAPASYAQLAATTSQLLTTLPPAVALERVVSEALGAEFVNLSYAHFRELRNDGTGPDWIRLASNRVGYRVRDLMAWCEQRKRLGKSAATTAA